MCSASSAAAELASLFPKGAPPQTATKASLFTSINEQGFFNPLANRALLNDPTPAIRTVSTPVDRLLSLIALAEAGPAGYNAVQHGARVPPPRPPTLLTLGEIYQWIDDTPGQPHAIGRYQFIPSTLRRVARARELEPDTQFSAGVQDALALVLLKEAGLSQFEIGTLERSHFMHNLAQIWAGLPMANGRSFYEGYAGNAATMTWVAFSGGMDRIWGG